MKKLFLTVISMILFSGLAFAGSAANVGTSIGANDNNFTANQHMASVTWADGNQQTQAYKVLFSSFITRPDDSQAIATAEGWVGILHSTITFTTAGNTRIVIGGGVLCNANDGGTYKLQAILDGSFIGIESRETKAGFIKTAPIKGVIKWNAEIFRILWLCLSSE